MLSSITKNRLIDHSIVIVDKIASLNDFMERDTAFDGCRFSESQPISRKHPLGTKMLSIRPKHRVDDLSSCHRVRGTRREQCVCRPNANTALRGS